MTQAPDALVIDASVAVKWYLPDELDVSVALALLDQFEHNTLQLAAPTHILYEVPSAITVATRRQQPRLAAADAQRALDAFFALNIPTFVDADLLRAAFVLTGAYGVAFYDAVYLALAQRLNLPLIVADRKFYQRIATLPDVIWLADW
jgi:predicted nucleic acid-binding protein